MKTALAMAHCVLRKPRFCVVCGGLQTGVEVVDDSDGCGAKFVVLIVSSSFAGKPLLQRHRLVNSILEDELKEIHAFSQKTLTPEEWEKQKKA